MGKRGKGRKRGRRRNEGRKRVKGREKDRGGVMRGTKRERIVSKGGQDKGIWRTRKENEREKGEREGAGKQGGKERRGERGETR